MKKWILEEPRDYFKGIGHDSLPTPTDILLYSRETKDTLQQEALQNRSHHRFVLAFNVKTSGHVHLDNRVVPLHPGQALLIHPYQFHHFSQLDALELHWLFCTFELATSLFVDEWRDRSIQIGENSDRALHELMAQWSARPRNDALLQIALIRLLAELKLNVHRSESDGVPEASDNLLRQINRLMHAWRGRPVLISDVAAELGLSESRIRTLFKEAAGIPLGSYLQNYRLNRAMGLLGTTTLSIAEIAEEAGFGSAQAFSRTFRKEMGTTPRDYRANR